MAKLHGKYGAIYLAPLGTAIPATPGTGGTVKVTNKTEWTLNLNRDYVDATVFGDPNKTYLVGLKDIQGTFAGLLDLAGDLMVNAASSEAQQIFVYADDNPQGSTSVHLVATGPGFLDASITASNTDAIKCTGNFRASGAWQVFSTVGGLT